MLFGSIPAVITPFQNHEVDYLSLEKIISYLIINGSNGLVPCGTTGESPTLSHQEHKKIIEETIRVADKRLPINILNNGGERGIRTLGRDYSLRRFSKPVV